MCFLGISIKVGDPLSSEAGQITGRASMMCKSRKLAMKPGHTSLTTRFGESLYSSLDFLIPFCS